MILSLKNAKLIGQGTFCDVYIHPHDETKCLKVQTRKKHYRWKIPGYSFTKADKAETIWPHLSL